jgi:predicted metal-dependent hydrolase
MIPGQKLLYTIFLALLVNAFVCTQATFVVAADGIIPSATDIEPVKTSEISPGFAAMTVEVANGNALKTYSLAEAGDNVSLSAGKVSD